MEDAHDKRRPPAVNYQTKVEQRAVKHKEISCRNNKTTCRSPTRELDTRWIKHHMHRKRQSEFFKMRPVDHDTLTPLSEEHATEHVTKALTSITRPLITSQDVISQRDATDIAKQSVTSSIINDENDSGLKSDGWDAPLLNSFRLRKKVKKERVLLKDITQFSSSQKMLQTASIQTESGFITVKEADVQQLADYLQEALYREEALKKKLCDLQRRASILLRSTEILWKTRCDEDSLKSKIKSLEDELQIYIKGGGKKVVLKMEKQRQDYEVKAQRAIYRAENEKVEAQSKMEQLQRALQTEQGESERWKRQCLELKESLRELKKIQHECTDRMLQLQGHLERAVVREEMLQKQTKSLLQERAELHSCNLELEEENLNLTKYLQDLKENSYDQNSTDASVLDQLLQTDNSIARQLRDTEHTLRIKDKEHMELQAAVEVLEQECYGYQSRLSQCREELNRLMTRQNNRREQSRCCGSWLCLCLFVLLLMVVVVVAALCWCHPHAGEQLHQLYSELEQRVEDYLIQKATAQHRACLRPV